MKGELRKFLLLIGIPSLLFGAVAIVLLITVSDRLRSSRAEFREERWKSLARNLQVELKSTGDAEEKRQEVLKEIIAVEEAVRGGFVWRKGVGLVVCAEIPDRVRSCLTPDRKWSVGGRTGALAPRGVEEVAGGADMLVWTRLGRNEVAGILVTPPGSSLIGDPVVVFALGGCVVMLLVMGGSWSYMRTARHEREENLRKTNFVSLVSHELKTPLTGIILSAKMLKDGRLTDPDDIREAYGVIHDESVRLNGLVNELLEMSRLEQKTKTYSVSDFDVVAVAEEARQAMRGRFSEHPLKRSGRRSMTVRADRESVKGILINLLDNAAKYASEAEVEIVCRSLGNGRVVVDVADRGPGLTDDQCAKVFERFWRADDRTVSEAGGFGLGLTISRRFARDLGGDLTARPRTGGGAVFTLELQEGADG